MKKTHPSKSGAALVIALGFLAVLTIMAIAFAMQMRRERLSGQAFADSARGGHLLQTALARAMEDIDAFAGSSYPQGFAWGCAGDSTNRMADSIDFAAETAYFQYGNTAIAAEYDAQMASATWDTVAAGTQAVGRVGYIVVNSSGLLDANHVGGAAGSTNVAERRAGTSPAEIQLAAHPGLVPEFSTGTSFNHFDLGNDDGVPRAAPDPSLSPALAFAYNRDHAWRRFETVRDILTLNNNDASGVVASNRIASFSTFSFDPEPEDGRAFMGTNLASVAARRTAIADVLRSNGTINVDFVMNQLIDYLDEDTVPEDPALSVEPVPLINELVFSCAFGFFPQIEVDEEGEPEVTSVIVSNTYSLDLEVWYPFVGFTNPGTYTVRINDTPEQSGFLPPELFGQGNGSGGSTNAVADWVGEHELPAGTTTPRSMPYDFSVYANEAGTDFSTAAEMVEVFEDMQTDIVFPSIFCDDAASNTVDRVEQLELPLVTAVRDELLPLVEGLASNLFNAATAQAASNNFVVSMACVDPRLNWDGASTNQWIEETSAGEDAVAGTLGAINQAQIDDYSDSPDDLDNPKVFVRNQDRIDSAWEFTYFLYDTRQPWKTMQMLEPHDDDGTRFILDALSPYPPGAKPRHGLVNPNTPHTNVVASVFMGMPLDEYNAPATKRLDAAQAADAAALFMQQAGGSPWPEAPSGYPAGFDLDRINGSLGAQGTWETEAFFRNTYELFNPRDTLYTILLAAQAGTDADGDGVISDEEVRGTQKAVAYVWRDPPTGKAAVVFWGLSDTLRSGAVGGQSWSGILQAFNPDA